MLSETDEIQHTSVLAQESIRDSTDPRNQHTPHSVTHHLHHAQEMWQSFFSRARQTRPTAPLQRSISLSRRNARTNVPWGDPLSSKEAGCTRLYAANVNGLQLDNRGGQYDDICKMIKEVGADLFCGQEINLDSSQHAVKQILYETTNQHWERAKIVFGSTPMVLSC